MSSNTMRLNIVGAGKVASTFAVLWQKSGTVNIQALWNRNPSKAVALQQRLPNSQIVSDLADLPAADIIVIGVCDDAIEHIAHQLIQYNKWITPETIVIHFSGVHSSNILQIMQTRTQLTGSLHPIFAFADIDYAISHIKGHFCTIESSKKIYSILIQLAQAAKMRYLVLDANQKTRYHAALSISANFLVALNAMGRNILQSVGLTEQQAAQLVNQLMQQNLAQLHQHKPEDALTGPIIRGDSKTIAMHWAALTEEEKNLYQALAKQTMKLSNLSVPKQKELLAIMKEVE